MTIYKYPIQITDFQKVTLPSNAKILTAQIQRGVLCLWVQVEETNTRTEDRSIEVFGTGHPMSQTTNRKYIGTAQMNNGSLVWHIFEIE